MSAKQYLPLSYIHNDIPVILYPAKDDGLLEKAFSRLTKGSLESYVNQIIDTDTDYYKGSDLIIAYIWNQEEIPYVDIWKVNRNSISDDSGLLYDVRVYSGNSRVTDMGIASGNSLIVLTAEEMLLRKLIVNDKLSFVQAANRLAYKALFPKDFMPSEEFYG